MRAVADGSGCGETRQRDDERHRQCRHSQGPPPGAPVMGAPLCRQDPFPTRTGRRAPLGGLVRRAVRTPGHGQHGIASVHSRLDCSPGTGRALSPPFRVRQDPPAVQVLALLPGGSAEFGEPLDHGEVRWNHLPRAVAVQGGGVHAQVAGQRRVAAVRAALQTRQQGRELRRLVADYVHAVRPHIRPSVPRLHGPDPCQPPAAPRTCTQLRPGWFRPHAIPLFVTHGLAANRS